MSEHLINFGCFAAVGGFVESLYGFVYDFFTPCRPYCVAVLFVVMLSLCSSLCSRCALVEYIVSKQVSLHADTDAFYMSENFI